jgi:hypothetical protein
MTSKRFITAIFIAAFLVGLMWGGRVRGLVSSFLIEGADEARYESLTQSYSLNILLDALGPHFIVDMADGLRHAPLNFPSGLQTFFDVMPIHFVIDMADGNRFHAVSYPDTLIGDATPPKEEGTPEIVTAGAGSVKIRWKTNEFSRGTIEFGTQPGQYNQSVSEPLHAKDHELTLTGLPAKGNIYYRITNIDPAGNSGHGPERSFALEGEGRKVFLPLTLDR